MEAEDTPNGGLEFEAEVAGLALPYTLGQDHVRTTMSYLLFLLLKKETFTLMYNR